MIVPSARGVGESPHRTIMPHLQMTDCLGMQLMTSLFDRVLRRPRRRFARGTRSEPQTCRDCGKRGMRRCGKCCGRGHGLGGGHCHECTASPGLQPCQTCSSALRQLVHLLVAEASSRGELVPEVVSALQSASIRDSVEVLLHLQRGKGERKSRYAARRVAVDILMRDKLRR